MAVVSKRRLSLVECSRYGTKSRTHGQVMLTLRRVSIVLIMQQLIAANVTRSLRMGQPKMQDMRIQHNIVENARDSAVES